jgi:hypothetical protein
MNSLDNCPLALQSNSLNIKNHLSTIKKHGLGPADPLKLNDSFWIEKSNMWGISEGDARGRTCANCEYYFDTPQIRACVANGPAKDLKASALPLTPKWADIESQPIGYCEKWDITCSPIRTCDDQEIYQRTDAPQEEEASLDYADPFKNSIKSSIEEL